MKTIVGTLLIILTLNNNIMSQNKSIKEIDLTKETVIPGSVSPLRTGHASFPAYGSGTFKAIPAKGHPTVKFCFLTCECSNLFTFCC